MFDWIYTKLYGLFKDIHETLEDKEVDGMHDLRCDTLTPPSKLDIFLMEHKFIDKMMSVLIWPVMIALAILLLYLAIKHTISVLFAIILLAILYFYFMEKDI